ncbi:MAG: hypothetical protein ACODAJ_03250 [Planctomycetota bacterium]
MDSPLAPRRIPPGIRTPRVTRSERDRKGKGGSFRDELAHEQDEEPERPPAQDAPKEPRPDPERPRRRDDEPGHLLDLEA